MNPGCTVLLYTITEPGRKQKIKFICVRLGAKIITVTPPEYLQPVGALAKIPGMEKCAGTYEGPGFSEEMMVLKGFTDGQLNDMLRAFRRERLEKVNLKAVLTDTNREWNSLELYEELKREHEKMSGAPGQA